jgi:NTE family protein
MARAKSKISKPSGESPRKSADANRRLGKIAGGKGAQPKDARKQPLFKSHTEHTGVPFECVALLLQGGGALGAYQAGVYQALAEANIHPNWVAGISIGAVNAAIIAGNAPQDRLEKLRQFWEILSPRHFGPMGPHIESALAQGDEARSFWNQALAATIVVTGIPGFFVPRIPSPVLYPPGTLEATSFYDTKQLRATLENLIDFDRLNSGEIRYSAGAVNIRSGNFVYFDTETHTIAPEHVMASGALPPGFPPIEIEGESFWDGGLVSNTPLQWVMDAGAGLDMLVFQVDLWCAEGEFPRNLAEVLTRNKEIQYSSRTRANTDWFKRAKKVRCALASLLEKLPPELMKSPEAEFLKDKADHSVANIIHLIYHSQSYEGFSKDFEFSRLTMDEHWRTGYNEAVRTLRHPEVVARPRSHDGVYTFDLAVDGRE